MRRVLAFLFAVVLLGLTTSARADVPTEMSVQGRLTNAAGNPVPAGFKTFTFKIFDLQVGGVEIWPGVPGETQLLSTDANGLWNAGVGTILPLTEAVFLNPVRWLQVTVNDGVNPIETLPRIELRTNPYTYRSATSQHADSLGNVTYSDLVDQFVDEVGDTMTGQLSIDWVQKNVGSSLSIDNHNDGWFPWWNDDLNFGTWGVVSDVDGDGNNFNVAVAAAARGNNNTVEANYGVLSFADGGNSMNIGVMGSTGMSGTSNYSGYFINGDFAVLAAASPGTNGVLLPNNSIDQTEILDEPGVASGIRGGGSVTTAPATFSTVTISTPGAGYVLILADACFRGSGATTWIDAVVQENGISFATWFWDSGDADTWYDLTQSLHTMRAVAGAGVYTYDLRLNVSPGGSPSVLVTNAKISAIFVPTSYGAVAAPVAEAGINNPADQAARIPKAIPVDFEADRAQSIATNQARIDREMAAMKAEIEALKKLLPASAVNEVAARGDQ